MSPEQYFITLTMNGKYVVYEADMDTSIYNYEAKTRYFCQDKQWKPTNQTIGDEIYFNSLRNLIRSLKQSKHKVYKGFSKELGEFINEIKARGDNLPIR